MKSHKNFKKILLSLLFLSLLITVVYPITTEARGLLESTKNPIVFKPQVGIPGLWNAGEKKVLVNNDTSYIAEMIRGFYNYGIGIAGILAAIMLMAGGLVWLTSAGSSEKITQAKNLMSGSIIGLVILFGSWILLRTINPALVDFRIATITTIETITYGCCEFSDSGQNKAESTSSKDCNNKNGVFNEPNEEGVYVSSGNKCVILYVGCNVSKDCDGNVTWCHDSDVKITGTQTCASGEKALYEFKNGRCSSHVECGGKRVNCLNIADGEKCKADKSLDDWWTRNIFTKVYGFCYDSMCYLGRGLEAERCGNKPGAFCSSSSCSDLGQAGEKYRKDGEVRWCSSNLHCCYKE